jgi:hypothetical protein
MKSAYFLSNIGLGDNITNISAINYLLKYYDTIFFLCKDINEENVRLFFKNKPVVTVTFNSKDEWTECEKIISQVSDDTDYFISGFHKTVITPRITNQEILAYKQIHKYNIEYIHIENLYKDLGLDSTVYIDYFDVESSDISKQYFDYIKQFKIVFLHTEGSNRQIDLSNIIKSYENNDEYILICPNKNIYNKNNNKYEIAEKYVNLKVAHYIDIIKQAQLIHVINSCFSSIVYPLNVAKKLNASECIIYHNNSIVTVKKPNLFGFK